MKAIALGFVVAFTLMLTVWLMGRAVDSVYRTGCTLGTNDEVCAKR